MASLHAKLKHLSRPWSSKEYTKFMENTHSVCVIGEFGFCIGNIIQTVAEISMILVEPRAHRQGFGSNYLKNFESQVKKLGAKACFLEVSITNIPAQTLYFRNGFQKVGSRKNYYRSLQGVREDGLILKKSLDN